MRPVPEYDAKSWILKALRETAHAMESLIWNIDDDALDRRPDEDEWSAKDLLWHMGEMERRYVDRLEAIVGLDCPPIAAFDADSIEPSDILDDQSIYELTDEFSAQRQRTTYLLWSLDDEDWQRCGVHPYLGQLTVMQTAREMNEHDLAHLWQLRRLCDRLELASV